MSRKPEQKLWDWLREKTRSVKSPPELDRVENKVGVSMPDVMFTALGFFGWIELKVIDYDPKEVGVCGPLVKHFTQGQKRWLKSRGKKAGACWFLLWNRHNDDLFLINYRYVEQVGNVPYRQLAALSEIQNHKSDEDAIHNIWRQIWRITN